MNSDLSKVVEGDYIWTIAEGWVKVRRTIPIFHSQASNEHPIETVGDYTYSLDGKLYINDKYPSAFTIPPKEFNPGPKPCEFKKGDRVMVQDEEDDDWWCKRYFIKYDGKHFIVSMDSIGWSGELENWDKCRKPTNEELR